jgi:hypothetical protein
MWAVIIYRGVKPALKGQSAFSLPYWILYSVVAIHVLFTSGFVSGPNTNLSLLISGAGVSYTCGQSVSLRSLQHHCRLLSGIHGFNYTSGCRQGDLPCYIAVSRLRSVGYLP